MVAILRQAFNGGNLFANQGRCLQLAGLGGLAVDMDGARSATGNAAAIFGAGEADFIAQHPQQWRIWIDIDIMRCTINS